MDSILSDKIKEINEEATNAHKNKKEKNSKRDKKPVELDEVFIKPVDTTTVTSYEVCENKREKKELKEIILMIDYILIALACIRFIIFGL